MPPLKFEFIGVTLLYFYIKSYCPSTSQIHNNKSSLRKKSEGKMVETFHEKGMCE